MLNKKEAKQISSYYGFFPKNRRGQGLSTNAIILIILGVIILVILIIGFLMGWQQLRDRIFPSNNVKDVVQNCNIACSTENVYEFCTLKRELKAGDLPGDVKSIEETCKFFAETVDYTPYGIKTCPGLCI